MLVLADGVGAEDPAQSARCSHTFDGHDEAAHAARPVYRRLLGSMIAGPVVVQVLEGDDAIAKHREVMGATDPAKAAPGTIRKDFAQSIEANSVHGSDSPENAAQEIAFFFADIEICP